MTDTADLFPPAAPATRPARLVAPENLPLVANPKAINVAVGSIAVLMPLGLILASWITGICSGHIFLDSLSHHYYAPLGGGIFVGALFTIGILMLFLFQRRVPDATAPGSGGPFGPDLRADGFANFTFWDMVRVRIAGVAAFAIALVPTSETGCEETGALLRGFAQLPDTGPAPAEMFEGVTVTFDLWTAFGKEFFLLDAIHLGAAGVMFGILGYMSLFVFTRVQSPSSVKPGTGRAEARESFGKLTGRKRLRNILYHLFGGLIFLSILALAAKNAIFSEEMVRVFNAWNGTFVIETVALVAFGASWMIKGRFIPFLNDRPKPDAPILETLT